MTVPELNPKPATVSTETTTTVMFFAGLALLFLGLGFAVGWSWGLVAVGSILIGVSLWLVAPIPNKGGQ